MTNSKYLEFEKISVLKTILTPINKILTWSFISNIYFLYYSITSVVNPLWNNV